MREQDQGNRVWEVRWTVMGLGVCLCVCERERDGVKTDRQTDRDHIHVSPHMPSITPHTHLHMILCTPIYVGYVICRPYP